jgi:hypothetical protein
MKIHFERSGGFIGKATTATINSEALTEEEVQQLQALIQAAAFFTLPMQLTKSAIKAADQFQYKVTIEDDTQTHTVETTDMAAPAELRPLLRQLTLLARRF